MWASPLLSKQVTQRAESINQQLYTLANACGYLLKSAASPELSYSLAGRLILSSSGWALLEVPNAIVRGFYDALHEPGAELPVKDGQLTGHVSVMTKEEVDQIGGPTKLVDRGHFFRWTPGPLRTVVPAGWKEMSRVWFVEVRSPELEKLRKSYGLSAIPNDGKHKFHVTIAIRRKGVLTEGNDVRKTAVDSSLDPFTGACELERQLKKTADYTGTIVDEPAQPIVEPLSAIKPVNPRNSFWDTLNRYQRGGLKRKFYGLQRALSNIGTDAGTYHKRIAIPKDRLTEDQIHALGFQPAVIAVPEAGQNRFTSYRHMENNYHIHSHPDHWIMHEDEHPSLTIALANAKTPVEKLKALGQGSAHILTEGVPGIYAYLRNAAGGALSGQAPSMSTALAEGGSVLKHSKPRWQMTVKDEKTADYTGTSADCVSMLPESAEVGLDEHKPDDVPVAENTETEQLPAEGQGPTLPYSGKEAHILITGHSGAGKSELAEALHSKLGLPIKAMDRDQLWQKSKVKDDPERFEPGTKAYDKFSRLRRKMTDYALSLPSPHIIEGCQLLSDPKRLVGHQTVLVDPPKQQVLVQRLKRDLEDGKLQRDGLMTRLTKAKGLLESLQPEVERLKQQPGVIHVNPKLEPKPEAAIKEGHYIPHQPTIAVDLDGTLTEPHKGGHIPGKFGKLRDDAKKVLDGWKKKGYRIIIWTSRDDNTEIRKWLADNKLPYDEINKNSKGPDTSSPKVVASVYVDDLAVNGLRDWKTIDEDVEAAFVRQKARIKKAAVDANGFVTYPLGMTGLQRTLATTGIGAGIGGLHGYFKKKHEDESRLGHVLKGTASGAATGLAIGKLYNTIMAPKPFKAPTPSDETTANFNSLASVLKHHGVQVGSQTPRIAIPKFVLNEGHLNELGFVPSYVSVPEHGQDMWKSFRHPLNNYHLHSHGSHWTMHEDARPALIGALAGAKTPLDRIKAIGQGIGHTIAEGIPATADYLREFFRHSNPVKAWQAPAMVTKQAELHQALVGTAYRGDKKVYVCPHCDTDLTAKDIYTDKKGWVFCRRCLRKGGGRLRLPETFEKTGALGVKPSDMIPALPQRASSNFWSRINQSSIDDAKAHIFKKTFNREAGLPAPVPPSSVSNYLVNRAERLAAIHNQGADQLATSGRHKLSILPVPTTNELAPINSEPASYFKGFRPKAVGAGLPNPEGQENTSYFVTAHPEIAAGYGHGAPNSYVAEIPGANLQQYGPFSPRSHQHMANDTRGMSRLGLWVKERGGLGNSLKTLIGKGTPYQPPGLTSDAPWGADERYERVFTHPYKDNQPVPITSYASKLFKALPSGTGYQQVFNKTAYSGALGSGACEGQGDTDPSRLVDATGSTPAGPEDQPASDALPDDDDNLFQEPDPAEFDMTLVKAGVDEAMAGTAENEIADDLDPVDQLGRVSAGPAVYQDSGSTGAQGVELAPSATSAEGNGLGTPTSAPIIRDGDELDAASSSTPMTGQIPHLSA